MSIPSDHEEINAHMQLTWEELKSKYATFPLEYDAWWNVNGKTPEGNPVFIASDHDKGVKMDYVYCQVGVNGRGYYHLMTKFAYVNLYNRIGSMGGTCCGGGTKDTKAMETTKWVVYNRSRCNCPNDAKAREQAINHMEGSKLPGHGLKL